MPDSGTHFARRCDGCGRPCDDLYCDLCLPAVTSDPDGPPRYEEPGIALLDQAPVEFLFRLRHVSAEHRERARRAIRDAKIAVRIFGRACHIYVVASKPIAHDWPKGDCFTCGEPLRDHEKRISKLAPPGAGYVIDEEMFLV